MKKAQKPGAGGRRNTPPSASMPTGNLAPRDLEKLGEELAAYHAEFAYLFKRREQRECAEFFLRCQLSDLERKTVEPMVLASKGRDPNAVRSLQQFLGEGRWDDAAILGRREELVAADIGVPDGVIICDGSSFPKKGDHSVGVARQYCGALGKIANCQQGVFTVYATSRGYTFVDRRLYMPEHWFCQDYADKRKRGGVPEDLCFKTEPQLAVEMLRGIVERQALEFQWVTADEHYGMNPDFLDSVAELGKYYFVEVPVSTVVWVGKVKAVAAGKGKMGRPRSGPTVAKGTPQPQQVRLIADQLPARAWQRYQIKEGAKGPIEADFAFVRATSKRGRRPGQQVWVVFRRGLGEGAETKVYLSNAPASCAKRKLVEMSGLRWPVETALEEGKGEVGMDHYETRSWVGWHHQMTLSFLAHHFLLRLRLKLKKRVLL